MESNTLKNSSHYFSLTPDETGKILKTDLKLGLDLKEARNRLERFGPNQIQKEAGSFLLKVFIRQVVNPMILLLLAVIGISILIGHLADAAIIGAIVLLNIVIGFVQEFRAEKAMASIRKMAVPVARVIRSGKVHQISALELVPGDLVQLEAGDRVPVDLRLVEAIRLQVDESLLTGESVPVFKETAALKETGLTLGDQVNMGFMGTHVVQGRGVGVCVATGSNTQLGKIAHLVSEEKGGEVPLKKKMNQLTGRLVLAAFLLCVLIFFLGILQKNDPVELLLLSISLAIAAIPEGLPAVITISLSLGALRLARQGVLIRHLQAVEALGSITTICADKTGTLTLNRMEVKEVTGKPSPQLYHALALCNDARLSQGEQPEAGDPMEIALLKFVEKGGQDPESLRQNSPRVDEIPFDPDRKRMTTVHENNGEWMVFMKGAPETVLQLCVQDATSREIFPLTEEKRQKLKEEQERMASAGLRILAVGMKKISNHHDQNHLEDEMTFLGFVGLQDPPRQEAKVAIADCRAAGIQPVMITGDHPATAMAIGRQLGIYQDGDEVITGNDLRREGRELLDKKALHTSIFARVTPEDKLKIIEVFQDDQQIVAMTGDGVNDAPALKKADVGVAMGRGTDVAKETSAMILIQENFATLVRAVREGRVIYDNIRKFVRYMLTTNFGEIATILLAMVLALPLPLMPVQILWVNLVTDGLPAIALGFEPAEGNVMAKSPRGKGESILGRGLWQHTLWVGLLMGFLSVGVMKMIWDSSQDLPRAQTITFTTLVLTQMGHVMGIRSESRPLWKIGLFSNYRLLVAVLLTVILQVVILYLPFLGEFFHTVPLTLGEITLCFALAAVIYLSVEIEKYLRFRIRRRLNRNETP